MGASFDESHWPVLLVTIDETPFSDEEFEAYLGEFDSYIQRGPMAAVVDIRVGPVPTMAQQKRQARWMKEQRAMVAANSAGNAFVVESAAIRFVLGAIFSLARMPCDYTVVSSVEEAFGWAQGQLMRGPRGLAS